MSQQKRTEEEKQHARQMRYKFEEISKLNEKIDQLENERRQYRGHAVRRLKWWIELHGKGATPNLAWLIEQDAKFLQTVSNFTW